MDAAFQMDWEFTTLGDICTQPQYGYTTKAAAEGEVHLLRTTDITAGKVTWDTVPYCSVDPDDVNKYLLHDGDIVISRAGSVGVSHRIRDRHHAVFASYLIRFRPFCDPECFACFLKSPKYWSAITEKQLGIAVPNVNASKLRTISFPLPPLVEQRAIVAKIEALFSELDKGVEQLQAVAEQLKRYRQAVLKAAFEGKLTAEWRAEKQAAGKLPSTEDLLEQIQTERAARYQQQLADWKQVVKDWEATGGKASGQKKPRKPAKPKDLPPLSAKELADLPDLPEKWAWVRFGKVVADFKRGPFGSAIKKAFFVPSGYKVYEQGNAIYRSTQRGEYYINQAKYEELEQFQIQPGDYIVSCSGTVGRIFRLPEDAPAGVINQALLRVRIEDAVLSHHAFLELFESVPFQRRILTDAKGTAMVNLAGVKEIRLVPYPLCSVREQQGIANGLEE